MDFITDLNTPTVSILGFNFVFKLLFFVILAGYALYAFLLLLRVRILSETVDTPHNKFVLLLSYANLGISLVGGFLAMILVFLA